MTNKLLPIYVLVDSEGHFAEKRNGGSKLPVFSSQHTAAVNRRHYKPKYTASNPIELQIVRYEGGYTE